MAEATIPTPSWGRIAPLRIIAPPEIMEDRSVLLISNQGPLAISFYDQGLRLRSLDEGAILHDYGIISHEPDARAPTLALAENGEAATISAGDLSLVIQFDPFSFALLKNGQCLIKSADDGHFVRRHRLPPFARRPKSGGTSRGWLISLALDHDEPIYGLGEKWGRLDRRGQIICSHNEDALGVNGEHSYKNTPFAFSPKGWGLFLHTPYDVTHAIGYAPWSHRSYVLDLEDDHLDLFLFSGDDGAAIIGQYTALTGRPPLPPLWSLGVILSKAYYRTADEILDAAKAVRDHDMPCDVITFDGRAWQDTDRRFQFGFDPKRYPDPKQVISSLKSMGFRICVWEYPMVSVDGPLFDNLAAKGWLLKDAKSGEAYRYEWDLEPFGAVLTPLPASGLIDFTHPDAYAFWRESHQALFDLGIDMLKPDFGEQVTEDMIAHNGATGAELHNVYSLLYNRCCYEAATAFCPSGAFLFSRSAWAGSQRYPAHWGGDPQADFEGLAASLRGGQSWGLSGGPFYATDVGGFYGDQRDRVLYTRWAQAAVFAAHMRLHGIGPREPWSYGEAAEGAVMDALRLRYRLLPYLWQAMETAHESGLPVQRAMVLGFPDDRAAWGFDTQFLCGPDLLVAPCLDPHGHVDVYLPHGDWARLPIPALIRGEATAPAAGEAFMGGLCHRLHLALDEIAVFARKGAQIPLGPAISRTDALSLVEGRPPISLIWEAGSGFIPS
ncbi:MULTISPECIES: TIM-barrel domain-containing protein [unclassified Iodidimonas]|jgi:alpha-D-xyloside xylohydrolase|uniref:glycoside hydrolase family 31 protein n=1 Tax=unclassified Iodidimonas TaxID=2626145 RepID=UPI0024827883|nr:MULTISPECIES: TIM-barrel domain-containing protein [unclassified Iodidimonas]